MLKHRSKSKDWRGLRNSRVQVAIFCLVLLLLVSAVLFHNHGKRTLFGFQTPRADIFQSLQLNPTVEFRNGTDVISQIPDSPKAVLFLAHGCSGHAFNFWDKSRSCPQCVGLPEERLLVLHALARNFAVLAISSAGRCWTFGEEMLIVKNIIRWWVVKNKLGKLPIVALGASSGGYFVSALASSFSFSSITIMIAEGIFDNIDITKKYPPTLFVQMPKDLYRQQKISEFASDMKNKGIDVAVIECLEFPLSPSFLADRIPGIDQAVSAKLFALFQARGFIDRNGYMKNDGRATRWKEALREDKKFLVNKNLFQHVQEELNVAFAYHEMTSLQAEQIFKWFESHMH